MFASDFESLYKLKHCQTNKSFDMSDVDRLIDLMALKLYKVEWLEERIYDIDHREENFESKVRYYKPDMQTEERARKEMLAELAKDRKNLPNLYKSLTEATKVYKEVHAQTIDVLKTKNLRVTALFLALDRMMYCTDNSRRSISPAKTRVVEGLAKDLEKIYNVKVDIFKDLHKDLDAIIKECEDAELEIE